MIDLAGIAIPDDPNVAKYADTARWLAVCEQRAQRLGLDRAPRRRVLDIGTGCGYFPFVCAGYGHFVIALDHPSRPQFYRDVTERLSVDVIDHAVTPLQPLPDVADLDVITAFMVTFNGHCTPNLWGPSEWAFFLDDCSSRLRPSGVIYLELNRERNGLLFTPELRQMFLDRGAVIHGHRVTIR